MLDEVGAKWARWRPEVGSQVEAKRWKPALVVARWPPSRLKQRRISQSQSRIIQSQRRISQSQPESDKADGVSLSPGPEIRSPLSIDFALFALISGSLAAGVLVPGFLVAWQFRE